MFSVHVKRLFRSLLLLFLATASWAAETPPLTHQLTPVDAVDAPALNLQDMDEEPFDLETLRGKVVVVNFWATWCPPCVREMPSLERLKQAVGEKGVEVVAVNVGEDFDTIFSFLGSLDPEPTFPLLLDEETSTLSDWKVRGLPTTMVVGPDGKLAFRAIGGREFDHPELIRQLLELQDSKP